MRPGPKPEARRRWRPPAPRARASWQSQRHQRPDAALELLAARPRRTELGMMVVQQIVADDREFEAWRGTPPDACIQLSVRGHARGRDGTDTAQVRVELDPVRQVDRRAQTKHLMRIVRLADPSADVAAVGIARNRRIEVRVAEMGSPRSDRLNVESELEPTRAPVQRIAHHERGKSRGSKLLAPKIVERMVEQRRVK